MTAACSPLAIYASGNVTQLAITGTFGATLSIGFNSGGFVGVIAVGGGATRELLIPVDTVLNRVMLSTASEREFIDLSPIRELV
jgi:hypothetical protein